jgi:hypothetical protein
MQSIAQKLEFIIDEYIATLRGLPENKMSYKPSPLKWSKKEIIGHLIDSAQNNIRRFIEAQYQEEPTIVYDQDKWVSLTGYQEYNLEDLKNLWYLLNKHIVAILKNMSNEVAQRKCFTREAHTIEWLATDYIKHLRHHLHQVLDLEPVAYP